jgi:hypothetical protein
MKQCVACGRRYGDNEVACPKCYCADWVTPQHSVNTHIASTSFVCRHCITLVEGGTARCPNCSKRLAPGLLTLFCMIGIFGIPLVLVYIAASYFFISKTDAFWLFPDGALCLIGAPIIYGLMQAKTWGWYLARWLLIFSLLAVAAMVFVAAKMEYTETSANLAGMLVLRFVGVLPLWLYLDTRDLREYCGVVFHG